MKFKKYILFQYMKNYPQGGLYDIEDSYDTLEEAIKYTEKGFRCSFEEIIDRDTWEIIWHSYN